MYGGLTLYMTKRTELLYGALSKYACDLLYTPRVDITYPLCCWMPLPRHMLYAYTRTNILHFVKPRPL